MDFVQQRELVTRYQAGDRRAGDLLLLGVERFIHVIAKRYMHPMKADYEDVLQAGREGFLKGVLRFDGRAIHLLTYASYWVKHDIQRFIQNEGAVVRWPVHYYGRYRDRAGNVYPKRRHLRQRSVFTFSEMTTAQHDLEQETFEERLTDDAPLAEEQLTDEELQYWIPKIAAHWMADLEPRHRDVLLRRFANPEEMLADIGRSYGVSRERIRQIEAEGLRLMHHRMGLDRIQPRGTKKPSFKQWIANLIPIMLEEQDLAARAEEIAAAKALADKRAVQIAQALQTARRVERLKPPAPAQPQWSPVAPLRPWRATR